MLIPGYITDFIGFLLFIPRFRTVFGMYLLQWIGNSGRFFSYINFGNTSFKQRNYKSFSTDDRHGHFNFAERDHQTDGSDVFIEGEAEERPNTGNLNWTKKISNN